MKNLEINGRDYKNNPVTRDELFEARTEVMQASKLMKENTNTSDFWKYFDEYNKAQMKYGTLKIMKSFAESADYERIAEHYKKEKLEAAIAEAAL